MTRVAINGFGRIGRSFFRASLERTAGFEVVAVNDLGDPETMAHLLAHDSVLGPLGDEVRIEGRSLVVGDSTGRLEKRDDAQKHLDARARTVVISAVANAADITIALGVNDDAYVLERHRIVMHDELRHPAH